jgi:hypothetical protein
MKRILLALLFALFSTGASAEKYDGIPERFFTLIAEGKVTAAVDFIYGTNEWLSRNFEQAKSLKEDLGQLEDLVGRYAYHELLVEQKAGTRYAHLVYLVGYERQPLRFDLQLYRSGKKWGCHSLSFDSKLTDEIEKAANQSLSRAGAPGK